MKKINFSTEFILVATLFTFVSLVSILSIYFVVPEFFGARSENRSYSGLRITGVDTPIEERFFNGLTANRYEDYLRDFCCELEAIGSAELYAPLLQTLSDSQETQEAIDEVNINEFIDQNEVIGISLSIFTESGVSTSLYFYFDKEQDRFSSVRNFFVPIDFESDFNQEFDPSDTDLSEGDRLAIALAADRVGKEVFENNREEIEAALEQEDLDENQTVLSRVEAEEENSVLLSIGEFDRSSFGYIYAPDGEVPDLSLDDFIYLEQLDENWYYFKQLIL